MRPIDADVMRNAIKLNPWATPEEIRQAELVKEWVDAQPTLTDAARLCKPIKIHDDLAFDGIGWCCSYCTKSISKIDKYCRECGSKIDWSKVNDR